MCVWIRRSRSERRHRWKEKREGGGFAGKSLSLHCRQKVWGGPEQGLVIRGAMLRAGMLGS